MAEAKTTAAEVKNTVEEKKPAQTIAEIWVKVFYGY